MTDNSLQLGFQVNIQNGPDGTPWVGMTFGMGTSSYTLGVPIGTVDNFLSMINSAVTDEVTKFNFARMSDQINSKLVLPNDAGQLLVPKLP